MIDHLRITKTANFHKLQKKLSDAAIDNLFRQIRAGQPSASQNLFYHRRERRRDALWSAISFSYDRSPAFLLEEANVRERIYGFMLLVEHRGHLAIIKSHLDLPAGFSSKYLGRIPTERINAAITRGDAVFQKIRLRNMSVSKLAMRSKTLEADDLRNAVGPAGSNRYAPQGYAVRTGVDHFSATPRTGRITQRSDRVDHIALADFACAVIDELVDDSNVAAPFIRTFAQAIDLASIRDSAQPITFAVDVAGLADAIYEDREIRLVRKKGKTHSELTKADGEAVLTELGAILEVKSSGKLFSLHQPGEAAEVGDIAINKERIALRDLQLPLSADVEVEQTQHPLGKDPDRLSLRRYINREDAFIVLFDDLALAYIDGTLFRDEALTNGGGDFLHYLLTEPLLAGVTDEKGKFTKKQKTFDADSTFGVVIESIAADDEVLVCDDLGDEWADFIGLNNTSNPPRISFYHAKHGKLTLGAGSFHVSVSQAIKNLGHMILPAATVEGKIPGWQQTYVSGSGIRTSISRVSRGNPGSLDRAFERARLAPDAFRRVCIVTSSLSRRAVERALTDMAAGRRPTPHFVQLYWLLQSFFSACIEVGAHGYVICRE